METLKDALKYVADLAVEAQSPQTIEIDGKIYCTKSLMRYDKPNYAAPIEAHTLTSLVDYIKNREDELRDKMIVQVNSPAEVILYSGLLEDRNRETLYETAALIPHFSYNMEYSQESFLIAMQSCFKDEGDRAAVTTLASNIESSQSTAYSDDGITQRAVIKTGITTKAEALVPNPVNLTPYRTFLEVEQPSSDFVFRIKDEKTEPRFKLIEADGGIWQIKAMKNIKEYLETELAEMIATGQIIVIA